MVRTARRAVPLCLCACVCVCLYRLLVYPVTLTIAFGLSALYTPPGYCLQGMRTASSRDALMSCRQLSSTSQQLTLRQRAQPLSLSLPQPPSLSLSLSLSVSAMSTVTDPSLPAARCLSQCFVTFQQFRFSHVSVENCFYGHTHKSRALIVTRQSAGAGAVEGVCVTGALAYLQFSLQLISVPSQIRQCGHIVAKSLAGRDCNALAL